MILKVTRTNYDRFIDECGESADSSVLTALRLRGWTIHVTDATPAACGEWFCEPLTGNIGLIK